MPKALFFDHAFELAVGSGNQAEVNLNRRGAANAYDAPLLQNAQEFGLHLHRHLANFVEKDRAALGEFKFAWFAILRGAGKRPWRIAKQFRFQQVSGNGRTIHRHKWPLTALARHVQGMGEEFFTGAAFAK